MRSAYIAVAFASAIIGHASAQEADQFDLHCTGQVVANDPGAHDNPPYAPFERGPLPYVTRLQVDLTAKLFCQDGCTVPEGIVAIASDGVMFRSATGLNFNRLVVSRVDGTFQATWAVPGNRAAHILYLEKTARGTCVKAPYTAMPKRVF